MTDSLAATLRVLLDALDATEPDWREVEQAWLEASLAAAGTEHELTIRSTGSALSLRDVERLRAAARHVRSRLLLTL